MDLFDCHHSEVISLETRVTHLASTTTTQRLFGPQWFYHLFVEVEPIFVVLFFRKPNPFNKLRHFKYKIRIVVRVSAVTSN